MCFIDSKIKIFGNFRIFVLSPIPRNENSKITEILQKRSLYWNVRMLLQNQLKCGSIDIKLNSFSHISYLDTSIWVFKNPNIVILSGYSNLIPFWLCQSKSQNNDQKLGPHWSVLCRPKNKYFPWLPGFRFEPYTQKGKPGNHGNSTKCHNTEIWECSFKTSWYTVEIAWNSKSFSNTANHVIGIWVTFKSLWVKN